MKKLRDTFVINEAGFNKRMFGRPYTSHDEGDPSNEPWGDSPPHFDDIDVIKINQLKSNVGFAYDAIAEIALSYLFVLGTDENGMLWAFLKNKMDMPPLFWSPNEGKWRKFERKKSKPAPRRGPGRPRKRI